MVIKKRDTKKVSLWCYFIVFKVYASNGSIVINSIFWVTMIGFPSSIENETLGTLEGKQPWNDQPVDVI